MKTPISSRWKARRHSVNALVDNLAFALSGVAALWLAWLVLSDGFSWGWYFLPFFILFWLVLAYLVLPRIHRILTGIYVPDYFIGRARTSDGLLGDPINLAALGSETELHAAMTRAGWILADEVTFGSSRRIITSTLLRRSYDEAPVSPLLLFGRQQDLAYQQEVEGNPAKRHHVRFWRCPEGWLLPGGHHADWLAAGTFDRAVGFSLFTLQITHKIDAKTDIERDHIVTTLASSNLEVKIRVIKDFSTGYHSRNGGGDTIETDGDLPIIDVSAVQLGSDDVDLAGRFEARRAALVEKRPVSTMLGVILMLVRVVVGTVSVTGILLQRPEIIAAAITGSPVSEAATDAAAAPIVVNAFIAIFAIGVLFYLLLAVLVFTGSNWARIASMVFSGLLIAISAISFFQGEAITLRNDTFGLPLDILVLLALSARHSRLWARRPAIAVVSGISPRVTR